MVERAEAREARRKAKARQRSAEQRAKQPKTLAWRRYLGTTILALGILGIGLSQCDQISSLINLTPSLTIEPQDPISRYYPQIKPREPKANGELYLAGGKIEWFNFTDKSFNDIAALQVYSYFHNLATKQEVYPYRGLSSVKFDFGFKPQEYREKVVFLIPEGSPIPNLNSKPMTNDVPARTYYMERGRTTVTFVRTYQSRIGLNEDPNNSFNIEACQSTAVVGSTLTDLMQAQEVICNSFGHAVTKYQEGDSFLKYDNWARGVTMTPANSPNTYYLHVLNEAEYNSIRIRQKVIG